MADEGDLVDYEGPDDHGDYDPDEYVDVHQDDEDEHAYPADEDAEYQQDDVDYDDEAYAEQQPEADELQGLSADHHIKEEHHEQEPEQASPGPGHEADAKSKGRIITLASTGKFDAILNAHEVAAPSGPANGAAVAAPAAAGAAGGGPATRAASAAAAAVPAPLAAAGQPAAASGRRKVGPISYFVIRSSGEANFNLALEYNAWGTPPYNTTKFSRAFAKGPVVLFMSINNSRAFQGYAWMTSDCWQGPAVPWKGLGSKPVSNFSVQWECTTPVPIEKFMHLQNTLSDNPNMNRQRDGQEVEVAVGHQMVMLLMAAQRAAGKPVPNFSARVGEDVRQAAAARRGRVLAPGAAGLMRGAGMPPGGMMPPGGPMWRPDGFGPRGPGGMPPHGPPGMMRQPPPPPGPGRGMGGPGMPFAVPSRLAGRLSGLPAEQRMGVHGQVQQQGLRGGSPGRGRSPDAQRGKRRSRSRSRSPIGVQELSYEQYLSVHGRVQDRIATLRGSAAAAGAGAAPAGQQQSAAGGSSWSKPASMAAAAKAAATGPVANGVAAGVGGGAIVPVGDGAAAAARASAMAAGGGGAAGRSQQQQQQGMRQHGQPGTGAMGSGMSGSQGMMGIPSEAEFVQWMEASYRNQGMEPPPRPAIVQEYQRRRAMMMQQQRAMMMGQGAGPMGGGMMGMGGMMGGGMMPGGMAAMGGGMMPGGMGMGMGGMPPGMGGMMMPGAMGMGLG